MTMHPGRLDLLFHALADPTRRAIVERLAAGEASFSAVTQPFAMAKPTLLKHVKVLEECGLIETRKQGRVRLCRLEPKALKETEDWLSRQKQMWEQRLDALDAFAVALYKQEQKEKADG